MAALASGPAVAAEFAWGTTQSAPAGTRAELFGVAAAAADDIWAVGGFNPGQPPTAVLIRPYAEHWNGTGWAATPVPLGQVFASQQVKLRGAAAIGPGGAWAVGHVDDISSLAARTLACSRYPAQSLILRWNGAEWLVQSTPDIGPLAAVAANDTTVGGLTSPSAMSIPTR